MRVVCKVRGSHKKTAAFLHNAKNLDVRGILQSAGADGVGRLQEATPVSSGETAASWYYRVEKTARGYSLSWRNNNINDGIPVVILLLYGHLTKGGGWIEGYDFVSEALEPVLKKLSDDLTKEVRNL